MQIAGIHGRSIVWHNPRAMDIPWYCTSKVHQKVDPWSRQNNAYAVALFLVHLRHGHSESLGYGKGPTRLLYICTLGELMRRHI